MMTADGDMRQLLGEVIASGKALGRQMDRIEAKFDDLADVHSKTRDMVLEQRTTLRIVKLAVTAAIGASAALGFDWWQR